MSPEIVTSNTLVISLWGFQASASGQLAILALSAIVLTLIVTKRLRWW